MIIEVENNLNERFGFDFKKNIDYILRKIPKEHILGVHKIQVLYTSPEKGRRHACGFYYGKTHGEKLPRVVICVENVFRGIPKFFLKINFITQLFLARTLFHEIGHHYQKLHHGLKKKAWESDADNYVKVMMKKHFKSQIILLEILFGPFIAIAKLKKRKSLNII